ncbi:DUF4176 domain-containing protein [Lacrimispora sp.]|jgi:hypothetical protein|uniref:DUF4176 domain-containing protein n=1 Tax=Lacrimispora sp. TaxID=2719234 RepID=UPI0028A98BD2|nr:DUF4176 domain-containing protein [Lacrimispora sp.]
MLPLGSIVYLTNGNQKVMIVNRGPLVDQDNKKVYFDYTGVIYPEGLDPEQVYYFHDEDIDEVVFEGFKDDDEKRFVELFNKWKEKNANLISKGKVEVP